jgi:hypothetical protein
MENTNPILNELKELSPVLASMEKVSPFTVPAGYFDQLASTMVTRVENADELNALSPSLASMERINPFTVPEGYFEMLTTDILMEIKHIHEQENNAVVPEGYFESLPAAIMARIKSQETENASTEIRELSPMLYSIQNENVFEVPAGYFDRLSGEILDKVKPAAKVVRMPFRKSFMRYAVAAAFTGMMALGVFKFTGNSQQTELPDYVTAGLQIKNVDQELAGISDAEIVKFLEEDGTDVKTAIVANSIDKNELPSQEDYLLDEKALDKYLDNINVDELKN